jgi:hypothetical protein
VKTGADVTSVVDPHWFHGFIADPDPDFISMRIRIRIQEAKPMQIQADPDPDQTFESQKVEFLH